MASSDFQKWLDRLRERPVLGYCNTAAQNSLSFVESAKFLQTAIDNENLSALVSPPDLVERVRAARPDMTVFASEDPRFDFFTAHNYLARKFDSFAFESRVSPDADIAPNVYISPKGVRIAGGAKIESNAAVLAGSVIGTGAIIRSGARIGIEGFEHKRVKNGILSIIHDRAAILGADVEIGGNCTVARGVMDRDTTVGDQTKTDCLVHIGHAAQIGQRCLLAASAMIAGSVDMGDDVWVGPNASVSSQISIGNGARITLGSVVTRHVPDSGHVSGNFAIEHRTFLRFLKSISKR